MKNKEMERKANFRATVTVLAVSVCIIVMVKKFSNVKEK